MKMFFTEFWSLTAEMAPYLLLGFLFAGILHAFIGDKYISKQLGEANFISVLKSTIFGIPLPLCSCGVIPTGIGLHRSGASKGATTSFMISTPQTGVDSILVTWSMLGLPFAILRPIVALITGVFGGLLTNFIDKDKNITLKNIKELDIEKESKPSISLTEKVKSSFKYGFYTLPADLAKWLIIGLLLAALVAVFVPRDFFEFVSNKPILEMLLMLLISLPLYVCATGSVPLAAVFLLNGISPGAVLVFLMAGPATNIATVTVIGNSLGRRNLFAYLFSIIFGAIGFGFLINFAFPDGFFIIGNHLSAHNHLEELGWIYHISAIVLLGILIFSFIKTKFISSVNIKQKNIDMEVKVKGMSCKHCTANIEKALINEPNIKEAKADLATDTVYIKGDNIDKARIEEVIKDSGYTAEF
jgi:uncharacterized membrane protein YraQ (UPF0718 family)/copper chaperone CopZ